ncbi:hypothetical protein Hanom_Chr00s000322g01637281 [Helianthus anomalus]
MGFIVRRSVKAGQAQFHCSGQVSGGQRVKVCFGFVTGVARVLFKWSLVYSFILFGFLARFWGHGKNQSSGQSQSTSVNGQHSGQQQVLRSNTVNSDLIKF